METTRIQTAAKLLRGVAAAAIATFPGMAILAAAVVFAQISDGTLTVLNQLLKAVCVFLGALTAVGAGGQRGFATGAAVGLLYMLIGYGLYCALDGTGASAKLLAVEALSGAGIGAVSGAICANLRPRKPRTPKRKPVAKRA